MEGQHSTAHNDASIMRKLLLAFLAREQRTPRGGRTLELQGRPMLRRRQSFRAESGWQDGFCLPRADTGAGVGGQPELEVVWKLLSQVRGCWLGPFTEKRRGSFTIRLLTPEAPGLARRLQTAAQCHHWFSLQHCLLQCDIGCAPV